MTDGGIVVSRILGASSSSPLVETMLLSMSWNKVGPMMMCVN